MIKTTPSEEVLQEIGSTCVEVEWQNPSWAQRKELFCFFYLVFLTEISSANGTELSVSVTHGGARSRPAHCGRRLRLLNFTDCLTSPWVDAASVSQSTTPGNYNR